MAGFPALTIILGVFCGILILSKLRVPIGLAVLIGSLALNLLAGRLPGRVLADLGTALSQPYFWMLLAVTASLVGLGTHMSEPANANAIISMARRWGGRHGRVWSLMTVPAVIGLVSMPAGALFSAPMVQQTVSERHWDSSWKAAVNYWFRHVWEYWAPIYPSVIVAIAVFQMEIWQYILALIVFTPLSFVAGYWFLLRPHRNMLAIDQNEIRSADRSIVAVMLPLGIMIACAIFLPSLLAHALPGMESQTRKLFAVLAGVGAAIVVIARQGGLMSLRRMFASMAAPATLNIVLTVGSVILFQDMLKASELLPAAGGELLDSGIPLLLVIALLPMLSGLVTGIAVGFTGLAFPLVVGLMNAEGSYLTPMATLVMAFVAGFMGVLLSPVHLCLLVSRDFFTAPLISVYRRIVPCACMMLVFALLLFGGFFALGW